MYGVNIEDSREQQSLELKELESEVASPRLSSRTESRSRSQSTLRSPKIEKIDRLMASLKEMETNAKRIEEEAEIGDASKRDMSGQGTRNNREAPPVIDALERSEKEEMTTMKEMQVSEGGAEDEISAQRELVQGLRKEVALTEKKFEDLRHSSDEGIKILKEQIRSSNQEVESLRLAFNDLKDDVAKREAHLRAIDGGKASSSRSLDEIKRSATAQRNLENEVKALQQAMCKGGLLLRHACRSFACRLELGMRISVWRNSVIQLIRHKRDEYLAVVHTWVDSYADHVAERTALGSKIGDLTGRVVVLLCREANANAIAVRREMGLRIAAWQAQAAFGALRQNKLAYL